MDKFPKSNLLYRRQYFVTDKPLIENNEVNPTIKIWQFKTDADDIILNVTSNTLDISSSTHKTYNNSKVENNQKFRETIISVVDPFLKLIPVTIFNRMGLRYIDSKCPLPAPGEFNKESFLSYYNTALNLDGLQINNIDAVSFYNVEILRNITNDTQVKYKESLLKENASWEYNLDFDGATVSLNPSEYLKKLDELHDHISISYERVIKEPVYKIMRTPKN